jgi:PGF-pre-PGF domain-containing protein/PGF-CTERM protein
VWKRSIFTLRHDFAGAPTSVPVGEGDLRAGLDGQATTKSLDENPLGVRTVDETVTLTFDDTRTLAPDAITGTPEVQLIAARLQGTGEQVRTFEGAIDLLDTENANENATFEQVGDIKTLNSDGTITFSHDPGLGPGHYVYFLTGVDTANSNQFNIDNNNDISISGDVTVYGVEQITFQKGAPTNINPPSAVIPGNDLSFGIDTTGQFSNSNDVTHTVLVYDNSTVASGNTGIFALNVDNLNQVDSNFNLSTDSTLRHSIADVNGVASVDEGIEVNGIDPSDGRVSRSLALGTIVDFVAEDIQGNPPNTEEFGAKSKLDASLNATASTNADTTITVESFSNFSTGTYRFVYIGTLESDASQVTTQTGTFSFVDQNTVEITVTATADNNNNAEADLGGDSSVETLSLNNIASGTEVTSQSFGTNRPPSIPDPTSDTISIASVGGSSSDPIDNIATFIDISAQTTSPGTQSTVTTTVNADRFNNPQNARVLRFNSTAGQYESLSTTVQSVSGGNVTLEFTTPGFSIFAVGESSPASPGDGGDDGDDDAGGGGGGGGGGGAFGLGGEASTNFAPSIQSGQVISDLSVTIQTLTTQEITATEVQSFPSSVPAVPGTFVAGIDISLPDRVADNAGSFELTVDRSRLQSAGATPQQLQVYKYNTATGWNPIQTSIVSSTGQDIVIEASTSSFSLFAVGTQAQVTATPTPALTATPTPAPTATPTPAPTATPTATPTSTPTGTPGFGIIIAIAAIATVAGVLLRRRTE